MLGLFKKKEAEPVSSPKQIPPKPKKENKPWGRKERLLIVIILLITIMAGLASFLSSQQQVSFPSLPNVSLEVPSRTIELEK